MSDMSAPNLFRLRVAYVKRGRLAYLGHLEVLRTVERIVRRAGLPYAVTQGFSPHMRVGFSSALPVGTSSEAEYYDVYLTAYVPAPEAYARLVAASPEDLAPTGCAYIDVRTPALTAQITRAVYRIELVMAPGRDARVDAVRAGIEGLLTDGQIPYVRGKKQKTLDLAGTLAAFEVAAGEGNIVLLTLDTRVSNEGSLRPEILLAALDRMLAPEASREGPIVSTGIQDLAAISRYAVCRTAQYVEEADGSLSMPLRTNETRPAPTSVSSVPSL